MKSHARTLLFEVAVSIYTDACAKSAADQPDLRDVKTIASRIENEGLSFLTITLPDFGKDFDEALSVGQVGSNHFRAFRKVRSGGKRGAIPAFLQGMLSRIFDLATGRIQNEPNVDSIESVRQIVYAFKKVLLPCTKQKDKAAVDEFAQIEHELQRPMPPEDIEDFILVARVLWDSVFHRDFDPYVDTCPKHGPGATAEGISGNQKYLHKSWHDRLEPFFPLIETAYANAGASFSKEVLDVTVVTEEQELPVKVTLVPKTLRGPRVIAIEPVCMQYTQQALSKYIIDILESDRLTRGHVNFHDQSINQRLAMTASRDKSLATIDLSSASDRVPLSLAARMFDGNPDLRDAILACRSTRARLPNGDILPLSKFASMGSALCFPVESMYFYTLCVGAQLKRHNLPVTYRNIYKVSRSVYVYGDDIIVPTDAAAFTIDYLQKYYCKVGATKSHWKGSFRESCGVDAYDGVLITPVYVRRLPPDGKRAADALISWTSTASQFYRKGYWRTAERMYNAVEEILGKLPYLSPRSTGLGRFSFLQRRTIGRWNPKLMRYEVRAYVPSAAYRSDRIDGEPALLKSLLHVQAVLDGECDSKHLERSARHGVAALKRRWIPVE